MNGCMKYISMTARCAILYHGERLSDIGLNGYQASYILHLCRTPGISQEELARRLHVNKSNVTRQLALLEKAGFVTRARSLSDRRQIQVEPTAKAVAALPAVQRVLRSYSDYLTETFTDEEKQTLDLLLSRIAARAEAGSARPKETK